jgi:hypothetical protein
MLQARGQHGKANLLIVNAKATGKVPNTAASNSARCEQYCSIFTSLSLGSVAATAV